MKITITDVPDDSTPEQRMAAWLATNTTAQLEAGRDRMLRRSHWKGDMIFVISQELYSRSVDQ